MLLWSIPTALEEHAKLPSSNGIGYVSGLPSCYANCFGLPLLNLWNYSERYKNKKTPIKMRVNLLFILILD